MQQKWLTVQDNKQQKKCEWKYTYTVLKLRVRQVMYESKIQWQHKKAQAARYWTRDLKNFCILLENSTEGLRSWRELCWSLVVSVFENTPKNLVVQGRAQLENSSHIVKVLFEAISNSTVGKCAPMQVIKQPEHGRTSASKEQKWSSFQTNYG